MIFKTKNIQKLSPWYTEPKQPFTLSGYRAVTPFHPLQDGPGFRDKQKSGTEFYLLNEAKSKQYWKIQIDDICYW